MFEVWEFDGDRCVYGIHVAEVVSDVVRERTEGEGKLIHVAGLADEVGDEVAGTDVVSEIAEGRMAEGVVAGILDDAAAVGISMGEAKLFGSGIGIAGQEDRLDTGFPGHVDDHFVGEK